MLYLIDINLYRTTLFLFVWLGCTKPRPSSGCCITIISSSTNISFVPIRYPNRCRNVLALYRRNAGGILLPPDHAARKAKNTPPPPPLLPANKIDGQLQADKLNRMVVVVVITVVNCESPLANKRLDRCNVSSEGQMIQLFYSARLPACEI